MNADIVSRFDATTPSRNAFENLDQFQQYIREAFINGSGIDAELFEACVEFHEDQEFDHGGEVSTPIHDALGWEFKRFGHKANDPLYAAFLKNEDGSIWQGIVSIWDDQRQRPYKYFAPQDNGDRTFLPPVPPGIRKRIGLKYGLEVPETGSFWEWLEDIDIPRLVTEGGKKGLCLLSQGYVGLALYGCRCGAKKEDELGNQVIPYLIKDLQRFAVEESKWLFALDRDEKHKAKLSVAAGKKKLRIALIASECVSADIIWKHEQGKGVDDFVVKNGSGDFDAAYQKAIQALERALAKDSVSPPEPAQSKTKQKLNLIACEWGDRLRFNEMTLKVELDGQPLDLDTLSIRIADEFSIDLSNSTACQIVLFLAKQKSYSPVREYLERVAADYPNQDLSILDGLATRYFGTEEPLHNTFMRKHLIGQVMRVFEPGCQHDTVLALQGLQGLQKSKFWKTLAVNPDWFDDTINTGNNDKDERLKLRRFWFLEMAEIESIFKRKEIATLRGFLTTKCDNLRVPYGRTVESFPRTSCFVATVNPSEFLVDPEGHRRFWVVPVKVDRIPIEKLKQELDQLWAAAVHAYRASETNYLTREDEIRNALLNKRFEVGDSWQEVIELYLETLKETTVTGVLSECLKIELGRHDRSSQMRVAECLKRAGWYKGEKKKVNGRVTPVWRCQPKISEGVKSVPVSKPLDIIGVSENGLTPLEKEDPIKTSPSNIYIDNSLTQDQIQGINQNQSINQVNQPLTTPGFELKNEVRDTSKKAPSDKPSVQPAQNQPKTAQPELIIRVGEKVDYCGEVVTIAGWENGGSKVQIEFSTGRFQTVKKGALKPLRKK